MSIIKAIPLSVAAAELQPSTHWRMDKSGKPRIAYHDALRSWFALPSGKRVQVYACADYQFRRFVQSCYKDGSKHLKSELDELLQGDMDSFTRWYILDTLLEAGIHLPLFATETAAIERIAV